MVLEQIKSKLVTRVRAGGQDGSALVWVLLMGLVVVSLLGILTVSVLAGLHRTVDGLNQMAVTQVTNIAVAEGVKNLGGDPSTAVPVNGCVVVDKTPVCYLTELVPVGEREPVFEYVLNVRVWVDQDGDGVAPESGYSVRSVSFPVRGVPVDSAGNVTALWGWGNHGVGGLGNIVFASDTAPVRVGVFDGSTGLSVADSGVGGVGSFGFIQYGASFGFGLPGEQVGVGLLGRTVLWGQLFVGADDGRCTGAGCDQGDLSVVPTRAGVPDSVMVGGETSFVAHVGDWVASEHGGQLPSGVLQVSGDLVLDVNTQVRAQTVLLVSGDVLVSPGVLVNNGGQVGGLQVHASGSVVSFGDGAGVTGLVWAPAAVCSSPGGTGSVSFVGSLVCGSVSVGAGWNHLFDVSAVSDVVEVWGETTWLWSVGEPVPTNTIGAGGVEVDPLVPGEGVPIVELPTPTGLRVSTQVTNLGLWTTSSFPVAWDSAGGAKEWEVRWSTDGGGGWSSVRRVTAPNAQVSGLLPNSPVLVQVRSVSGSMSSEWVSLNTASRPAPPARAHWSSYTRLNAPWFAVIVIGDTASYELTRVVSTAPYRQVVSVVESVHELAGRYNTATRDGFNPNDSFTLRAVSPHVSGLLSAPLTRWS